MTQAQLHHDQHQDNSYFLSKYHDQWSQASKQESKSTRSSSWLPTLMLGSKRCMWCEVEEMVGGSYGGQR